MAILYSLRIYNNKTNQMYLIIFWPSIVSFCYTISNMLASAVYVISMDPRSMYKQLKQ